MMTMFYLQYCLALPFSGLHQVQRVGMGRGMWGCLGRRVTTSYEFLEMLQSGSGGNLNLKGYSIAALSHTRSIKWANQTAHAQCSAYLFSLPSLCFALLFWGGIVWECTLTGLFSYNRALEQGKKMAVLWNVFTGFFVGLNHFNSLCIFILF